MGTLSDKVIIITGASGGIGRATALRLATDGAKIVLAARNTMALNTVAEEVRRMGERVVAVPTDVTQKSQVADLVSEAVATFGSINVMVNCAGSA